MPVKKGQKINYPKNRKQVSEKVRQERSKRIMGEKNPNFKDGNRISGGKWQSIKTKARIRDDHTCQICGLREIEIMEVDHIKPRSRFPELEYVLENLLTLCPNCHRRKTVRDRKMYSFGI